MTNSSVYKILNTCNVWEKSKLVPPRLFCWKEWEVFLPLSRRNPFGARSTHRCLAFPLGFFAVLYVHCWRSSTCARNVNAVTLLYLEQTSTCSSVWECDGGEKRTVGSAEMPWREEHWIMCLVKRTLDCQDHLCWYKEKVTLRSAPYPKRTVLLLHPKATISLSILSQRLL